MIIQIIAIGQYFHVVLFITLCKVVLIFKSVDETLAYGPIKSKLLSSTFIWFANIAVQDGLTRTRAYKTISKSPVWETLNSNKEGGT